MNHPRAVESSIKNLRHLAVVVVPLALASCGDAAGPEDRARVDVAFATTAEATAGDELVLTGSNGTLVITDIRMIVAEFEMEGPDACVPAQDAEDPELEKCEFESDPFLLDLPHDGSQLTVATADLPSGVYTELEFEVENLDEDEDDDFGDALVGLRQQMRAAYPLFPDRASMVVSGTFTRQGGAEEAFTVYLDAEVEVEMDLIPALIIEDEDPRTVTVRMDPAGWFLTDGLVSKLSAFDGQLLEFEAEFENGVHEVEWDDG